jgi:hypothetical protein
MLIFLMAQATATIQADVNLRTLRAAEARQALGRSVEVRRGEVHSITLTIPLLTDRNSYLVVRLPDAAVQEMLGHVRTLPEGQRRAFVTNWVMRNQQAVLEQFVSSGGHERHFRYNVVPVLAQPPIMESTPRRIEEQRAPPVSTRVPRREEHPQPPAERPAQAPPQQAPRAPRQAPQAPSGGLRITRSLPPLPRQVKGGSGTRQSPYRVEPEAGRRSGEGVEATAVNVPFVMSIEGIGTVVFNVTFTASQLARSNQQATRGEVWGIFRQTFDRVAAERQVRTESTAFRDALPNFNRAFEQAIRRVEDADPDVRDYIRTH